jgi:hypothetical protein
MFVKGVAMLVLVCGALSCGSGAKDPPERCGEVVGRLCARIVACLNDGMTTQGECEAFTRTELPCTRAESVTDSYGACAADVQAAECETLGSGPFYLPATCRAAFVFEDP